MHSEHVLGMYAIKWLPYHIEMNKKGSIYVLTPFQRNLQIENLVHSAKSLQQRSKYIPLHVRLMEVADVRCMDTHTKYM